jgi:hypothetical protein
MKKKIIRWILAFVIVSLVSVVAFAVHAYNSFVWHDIETGHPRERLYSRNVIDWTLINKRNDIIIKSIAVFERESKQGEFVIEFKSVTQGHDIIMANIINKKCYGCFDGDFFKILNIGYLTTVHPYRNEVSKTSFAEFDAPVSSVSVGDIQTISYNIYDYGRLNVRIR